VLDGTAAEVSFKLPPTRFASFLVGEPKAFPFIVRRRFPSVMRLLVASDGDKGGLVDLHYGPREIKERRRIPKRGRRDG
jgi:hypothetical protein